MSTGKKSRLRSLGAGLALLLLATGCRQDMHDQPKIEPFEENAFFADGMGSRQSPAGTVARGHLREDTHRYQGTDEEGNVLDSLPEGIEMSPELLWRGHDRYEIFCSVCHGSTGAGDGMIVRRGFKQPPPIWEDRLIDLPLGYYFDVMTNGYGVMSSYAKQVPVDDRWAIAAYIRALQVSQTSRLDQLPADLAASFQEALTAPKDEHGGGHGDGHGEDEGGDHH